MNSINIDMATPANASSAVSSSSSVGSRQAQPLSQSLEVRTLANISIGEKCVVRQLLASTSVPEWLTQLEDIGFIAGEPVTLMARGAFGGDPLVVRIGLSTFALRKAEAACVLVDVAKQVVDEDLQNKVAA
ncbi:FeoA family protein [Undibacterium danionis]|uniref:Ferrous iron transport protein A n=1 Tax=Undibacterium danionis TaxID=1812100 RepID=A0ABV6IBQ6_9BURK